MRPMAFGEIAMRGNGFPALVALRDRTWQGCDSLKSGAMVQ